MLLGFSGFYLVLLGFTRFYWVLLGFTGFYWVLLGLTRRFFYTSIYWIKKNSILERNQSFLKTMKTNGHHVTGFFRLPSFAALLSLPR